jgi:hypothetical protein
MLRVFLCGESLLTCSCLHDHDGSLSGRNEALMNGYVGYGGSGMDIAGDGKVTRRRAIMIEIKTKSCFRQVFSYV